MGKKNQTVFSAKVKNQKQDLVTNKKHWRRRGAIQGPDLAGASAQAGGWRQDSGRPALPRGWGPPKCTEGESLVSLQFLGFSYPTADSGSTMTGFFIPRPEGGRKGGLILASLPQLSEGRGGERTQQRSGPQQTADAALGAWPEAAGQVGLWLSSQLIPEPREPREPRKHTLLRGVGGVGRVPCD